MIIFLVLVLYVAIVAGGVFIILVTNKPENPLISMGERIRVDLIEKKYRNRNKEQLRWGKLFYRQ